MKNFVKMAAFTFLAVPAIALSYAPAVSAADDFSGGISGGANSARGANTPGSLFGDNNGNGGIFKLAVNVMLFLIGAISVIMLIVGGIRYTISQGDQAAVTSAKNTILYSIVGIIIALLAYAIVNFVIGAFAREDVGASPATSSKML